MSHPSAHPDDPHYVTRNSWLRAAVLGANDGIVSVSSLVAGVAAAEPDARVIFVAGVAGLVAGAMSMAAGEYVSVSSQSDTERADIKREEVALRDMPAAELEELVEIYCLRGLTDEPHAKWRKSYQSMTLSALISVMSWGCRKFIPPTRLRPPLPLA